MSKLPRDLAIEILCGVPVKSLLRFRLLSIQMCHLIDDPVFKRLHYNSTEKKNINLNLILSAAKSLPKVLSVDLDTVNNPIEFDLPCRSRKIIGACHGLIAVEGLDDTTLLFNPITKEIRAIPNFWRDLRGSFPFFWGFGYDIKNDDYKLVFGLISPSIMQPEMVIVFSLKANSWSKRDMGDFPWEKYPRGRGVYANGALYWKPKQEPWEYNDDDDDCGYLLAFDLSRGDFRSLQLPDGKGNSLAMMLKNFGGCLCLTCFKDENVLELWTMKEYGIKESWTKLICQRSTIESFYPILAEPLFYSECHNIILFKRGASFFWYNLSKHTTESVEIPEAHMYANARALVYTSSLVSFNGNVSARKSRKRRINGGLTEDVYIHFS